MDLDDDACYRAVQGRDNRFDGVFWTAVRTTGIYCRPSCPAVTPRRGNVSFHRSAAAAQQAGYRACKRCLPDAVPGAPDWDVSGDVAGRAMRLIGDGVVDRDGVDGLAAALGYSTRQLNRIVTAAYGAGPLALARSRRAQAARTLVEGSALSFADVAFAAGFGSIRQFNDTVREVYAASPSELRGRRGGTPAPGPVSSGPVSSGLVTTRIGVREPFDGASLLAFLALRAVPGVEAADATTYERSMRLPHGPGVVRITLVGRPAGVVPCRFALADARDLAPAVERTRRLLDADADPVAIDAQLGRDPALAALVRRRPGLRVPGHVDGFELAVRAVLGQQVSVAGARTTAARLVAAHGDDLALVGEHRVDRLFPDAATLAGADPARLGVPGTRARALTTLAAGVAAGGVRLDRGADRADVRAALLALPGIGRWTADYVAMRALGDPDVLLATDLGVRRSAARLGIDLAAAAAWRPWRSYALLHLWSAEADGEETGRGHAGGGSDVDDARLARR